MFESGEDDISKVRTIHGGYLKNDETGQPYLARPRPHEASHSIPRAGIDGRVAAESEDRRFPQQVETRRLFGDFEQATDNKARLCVGRRVVIETKDDLGGKARDGAPNFRDMLA